MSSLETAPDLPWFRNQNELPGPLPTTAQIEAASTELPNTYTPSLRRTVLVNKKFVVKYGLLVYENEGFAMLLLEKAKKIPVPRLYAMYREKERLFIIMEFIPGQQLSKIWPSLSEDEKSPIVHQLKGAFNNLRKLSPRMSFSGVFGGAFTHRYFFSHTKDPRITGPFTTEEEFCNALILRSQEKWALYGQRGYMTEFFSRHLPTILKGHSIVFSHSDLHRKNILVEEIGQLDNGQRLFTVSAIIDWEFAGWYPSYWEYAVCFTWFDWSDDWAEKVEHILTPYAKESPILRMLGHDLDS